MLSVAAGLLEESAARAATDAIGQAAAAAEARIGGRVGVCVFDPATGDRFGHRADERFPMCSTFKAVAVATVLNRVDEGREDLRSFVRYGKGELLDHAPVARLHLQQGGMNVEALCAAAIEQSDNTAANLLLARVGGPAGVTAFLRSIGDGVTRLDRTEPSLNSAIPGDLRDTTTPAAMAWTLKRLLAGPALKARSRGRLTGWMLHCATGQQRLRAGVPAAWRVADKTGTGEHGSANDIAALWPPGRGPLLAAVYCTGSHAPAAALDGAIAEVGRAIARSRV